MTCTVAHKRRTKAHSLLMTLGILPGSSYSITALPFFCLFVCFSRVHESLLESSCRRPQCHAHQLHLGIPNGTGVSYHMYFQSQDPGQSVGSIWGHTVSRDLVRWKRLNRTGVKGSSGGGVWLPPESQTHATPTTAAWNAAVFASVPM